jgi:hypothetical protein
VDDEEKTCAWCNKETLLALFGVALGVLFIAMGVDTLRRMRLSERISGQETIEGVVVSDD